MTSSSTEETNSAAWVSRLERRLVKLADTASKESMQALAKWIGFNRKHAAAFAKSLANAIADPSQLGNNSTATVSADSSSTAARQWLYLQVLHETIVLDSGTSRWDRFAEMREIMGEGVMVEIATKGCLDAALVKKVEGLVKQWDAVNAFGGPTMVNQIKKLLASPPPTKSKDKQTNSEAATKTTTNETKETKETVPTTSSTKRPKSPKRDREESPKQLKPQTETKAEPQGSTSSSPTKDTTDAATTATSKITEPATKATTKKEADGAKKVEYDFESKNIPYGKVGPRDFLAHCKAIATLQIARDMRNDSAVQLSSLLKALPEELQQVCEEADQEVKETGKQYQMPDNKAREFSLKTSEKLLDMDLQEQVQNVRTFLEIVEKQREARERLIYLLIRSRCQFGADDAAEQFYKLDDTLVQLQTVKEKLQDAMELEGLDFEEAVPSSPKKKAEGELELKPLSWYKGGKDYDGGEPGPKRLKLDG